MTESEHERTRESLRADALALRCPRCGAHAGVSCVTSAPRPARRRYLGGLHAERLELAEGLPSKENRQRPPRRAWGQGSRPDADRAPASTTTSRLPEMSDQPFTICERCREPVERDEPDVVEAVEVVPVQGFGATSDTADGMHALFHSRCFPHEHPRWRLL